jgi:hypothetical protein
MSNRTGKLPSSSFTPQLALGALSVDWRQEKEQMEAALKTESNDAIPSRCINNLVENA